jgi:hypothetical protein
LEEWNQSQIRRSILACSGFTDLGMFQDAVQELEALPESIRESTPILIAWLELYQGWQKWSEAMAVAEHLVAREPGDPNWPVALAYATRRGISLKAALRILQEAYFHFQIALRSILIWLATMPSCTSWRRLTFTCNRPASSIRPFG